MKIAITGGHHSSAVPVISELCNRVSIVEIYWFGHRHSLKGDINDTLEYKEITALNIPFIDLKAGKFYKTFDPIRLLKIPFGFFQALYYLLKLRPQVILSFGGYLAVPVVLAGFILGIPSITHEQTVVVGYANRLISFFAKKILISWEESKKFFPPRKTVFTGLPLRRAIFEVRSSKFNVNPQLPTLYITAGKTGSHKINRIIKEILPQLLSVCNVIHQCGDYSKYDDYEELKDVATAIESKGCYFLEKFIFEDEIGEVFSKADVFLSRAGAHITKEIFTFKKKAILIPIPWVSHNEQYENARILENIDLATILNEKDLTANMLLNVVRRCLLDIDVARYLPVYDASASIEIVNWILTYAKKSTA